MPSLPGRIDEDGAVTQVEIALTEAEELSFAAAPGTYTTLALFDTGAALTVVHPACPRVPEGWPPGLHPRLGPGTR
jgi:hypothetical protein